ncbi:MAG TPA: leucyl/phenylalanyl-tRNA--protein transferase [Blastocatellia bacterium]|nr:leucyl/phenylalanyl-tRNA--protein transferase [Blastocatellia bacterium]
MRKPSFLSRITTRHVLAAYHQGMFPMADGKDGPINWYIASRRALIPLDERFQVRRSLQKIIRRGDFSITIDKAFEEVIRACARHDDKQADGVWLSDEMISLYIELHQEGHTHSVEVWREGRLIGGLYGVAVGAAFCGESMFSREPYGSQIALVALVERLRERQYQLLDAQIMSPHLRQFGAYDVSHTEYLDLLAQAAQEARYFI